MDTYEAVLTKRTQLTHDTYIYAFSIEQDKEFVFRAGQYLILLIPRSDGEVARRLYSLVSRPDQPRHIEILIKKVHDGVASNFLSSVNVGDRVKFDGPAGVFYLRASVRPKLLLAASSGIAPIWSMLMTLAHEGSFRHKVELAWGLRNEHDMYFEKDLKELAAHEPNFSYTLCYSREGEKLGDDHTVYKRIDAYMSERIQQGASYVGHDCYICGGVNATENLRQMLYQAGVIREQVFFEKFV